MIRIPYPQRPRSPGYYHVPLSILFPETMYLPRISSRIETVLDPEYYKVFIVLLNFFYTTDDITRLADAIDQFAERFLVLPQIWEFRKR